MLLDTFSSSILVVHRSIDRTFSRGYHSYFCSIAVDTVHAETDCSIDFPRGCSMGVVDISVGFLLLSCCRISSWPSDQKVGSKLR